MSKWKWFSKCKFAEDGKKLYRDLSRKYHPDNGWKGDELKSVTAEFRSWWAVYKNVHRTDENADTQNSEHERKRPEVNIDAFIDIINTLSVIPGIEIDIVGTWLWLRGNTFAFREELKEVGCRWSGKHKMWYWTEAPYCKRPGKNSYNELKDIYGCETVRPEKRVYIGA